VASKPSFIARIKSRNMELQFWGYETGNVLATIAGAGGFLSFFEVIHAVINDRSEREFGIAHQLLIRYPDAAVTLGLGMLVLVVPAIRGRVLARWHPRSLNMIDLATTVAALAILCFSILQDASSIAVASSCFVLASCFLRHSRRNPVLLKVGGLALALGGIGLAIFGYQVALSPEAIENRTLVAMGILTLATGVHVSYAGLLTYEGGIFAARNTVATEPDRLGDVWLARLIDPVSGILVRGVFNRTDRLILACNRRISKPAIFWVSDLTKRTRPFKTSMLARMPWRLLTGMAALSSMTPTGFALFAANVCWAIGDLAIGSEDW